MSLPSAAPSALPHPQSGLDFPVVGIGASAGGIAAIKALLEGLPAAPDMAFVVVIHLSPTHESNAAAIFQHATRMPVAQVQGTVKIERNHVYVIPPTHDLTMVDGALHLNPSNRQRGRPAAIDLFFRTLADAHRDRAIGIVLSGSGSDGAAGIARLKELGGVVLAQSPEDAEYDGMPKSTIATGKVDIVLPVAEMPERLIQLWKNARKIEIPDGPEIGTATHLPASPEAAEEALREVMKTLQHRTGHDFKNYKRATVLRRIERRMQVTGVADLPAYRDLMQSDVSEPRALLDDMLIGVTQFFRDRALFETLEREIIPKLFAEASTDEPVRVWVAACSTGEEAYSVAMLCADEASRSERPLSFTVFATDIDEGAIVAGRAGFYPEAIAVDVPPARLRNFFAGESGGYRIHKSLRERVIFALHNVLRDPPFSRLDLIVCRNLLIYLDRAAQRNVLEMFHFALRPGGHLFLGSSETVDAAARLFTPVDKLARIYRSNPTARPLRALTIPPLGSVTTRPRAPVLPAATRPPTSAELHQQLIEQFAPASVLVTAEYEILHVSANAASLLRYSGGEPSLNLLRAVPEGLRQDLRTALFQALQTHERVDIPAVAMAGDEPAKRIAMSVVPVRHTTWPGELLLVSFDVGDDEAGGAASGAAAGAANDPALGRLESELLRKADQLRTTVEQYEASAEELKASNEELQAINEELRSATEELETSKEELQSTNEELITVNHELKSKIEELSEANDDLKNLIASGDVATVFIDAEMRIKRFTPAAAALFNIIAADVGRELFDLSHKLDYPQLAEDARDVYTSLKPREREVTSSDGRIHVARVSPYRTTENRIGGVVLTFVDVSSLRQAEAAALSGRERMALMAETVTDYAITMLDPEGRIQTWNAGAVRLFGQTAEQAIGQPFEVLFTPEDRAAGIPALELETARTTGRAPDDRWMFRQDGNRFFASGVTTALRAGGLTGFAKILRDFTHLHTVEEQRERQLAVAREGAAEALAENQLKNQFLAVMSHELKHPLNLINVNAQLLMTLPDAQGSEPVLRAARTIQRTVQSQARIIDDLLDMSRVQTGKLALNRKPVLLSEAVQPCMNWAVAELRAKGVRLYAEGFDEPLTVDGDPVRIEQIAWNLLSNAIKFSRNGGTISVKLRRADEDAVLEVTDTGRGISPAFLPHVFEMFKQADSAMTRSEGGLGIGLALVKSLAEMHGGSVEVTSEGVGRGATFRVRLPLHQETGFGALDASERGVRRGLAGARILIVDDTEDTLETFAMLLQAEGALVTTAVSGADALRLCEQADFDLIVSDIGMPQMDGCEMMVELRSRPGTATVPAVALTGYGRPQDVQRALASGFQAHIDKPVDYAHMRDVMTALLSVPTSVPAPAPADDREATAK